MSRSYKKTPYSGDKNDKAYKKLSNRKIRKNKDIPDGKEYKKIISPWLIKDYYDIMSLKEWLDWRGKDYSSEEEAIIEYNRYYRRK